MSTELLIPVIVTPVPTPAPTPEPGSDPFWKKWWFLVAVAAGLAAAAYSTYYYLRIRPVKIVLRRLTTDTIFRTDRTKQTRMKDALTREPIKQTKRTIKTALGDNSWDIEKTIRQLADEYAMPEETHGALSGALSDATNAASLRPGSGRGFLAEPDDDRVQLILKL